MHNEIRVDSRDNIIQHNSCAAVAAFKFIGRINLKHVKRPKEEKSGPHNPGDRGKEKKRNQNSRHFIDDNTPGIFSPSHLLHDASGEKPPGRNSPKASQIQGHMPLQKPIKKNSHGTGERARGDREIPAIKKSSAYLMKPF